MKKDRAQRQAVGAEKSERVLLREWVEEQEAFARELAEMARLILKHTQLFRQLYDERPHGFRIQ